MSVPTEEARMQMIRDAIGAAEKDPNVERPRITWKTGYFTAIVVELPVDAVLLNPRSHRIRSQLESHPKKSEIDSDPYGSESQKAISDLLRQTQNFERLRDNLKDEKQRDFGIVTHKGLLVNANTRCVALRDIGTKYIRVAVLPEDAKQQEIDLLELQLQMQPDFRDAYSFSNALLFVDDLLKIYKYTDEQVALEMRLASQNNLKKGAEEVQKRVRILATTRDLQYMSNDTLPLPWFDDKEQAMLELDSEIEKLKKQDSDAARRLKNNRMLGMLVGIGYRELREMNANFAEQYLSPALEEQSLFRGRVADLIAKPENQSGAELKGLDVFDDEFDAPPTIDVEPLVERLARSLGQDTIALIDADTEAATEDEDRSEVVAQLNEAIIDAANDARTERQQGALQERPRKLLSQAAKSVRWATEAYKQVKDRDDFEKVPFDKARSDLTTAVTKLNALVDPADAG